MMATDKKQTSNGVNLSSVIETILFVHGDPIALRKLAHIAGATEQKTRSALERLRMDYQKRGLALLEKKDEFQLGSNPANTAYTETLLKDMLHEDLSRAALETIAVIAYKGPLTRAHIEYIRGVNSSFTLRNLMVRGLIERIDNQKDARVPLYQITIQLLSHFGITRIQELPGYAAFQKEKIEIPEEVKNLETKL